MPVLNLLLRIGVASSMFASFCNTCATVRILVVRQYAIPHEPPPVGQLHADSTEYFPNSATRKSGALSRCDKRRQVLSIILASSHPHAPAAARHNQSERRQPRPTSYVCLPLSVTPPSIRRALYRCHDLPGTMIPWPGFSWSSHLPSTRCSLPNRLRASASSN